MGIEQPPQQETLDRLAEVEIAILRARQSFHGRSRESKLLKVSATNIARIREALEEGKTLQQLRDESMRGNGGTAPATQP